ncbi:MAG: hypothetical protein ACRCTW_02330 [Lactococcus garvieae]
MNITTIYDSRQLEKTADLIPTSSKLKAAIRSLFSYCSITSQKTFVCHPKQRTIAARAGVCLKTVSRAVGFLCASGVLSVEDGYYSQNGQARRTSSFYTVHLDRLKDLIESRFKTRKIIRKQRVSKNSVSNTCPINKQKGSLNKKKKAFKPTFLWRKQTNSSAVDDKPLKNQKPTGRLEAANKAFDANHAEIQATKNSADRNARIAADLLRRFFNRC